AEWIRSLYWIVDGLHPLLVQLRQMPKPAVAAVQVAAAGGGLVFRKAPAEFSGNGGGVTKPRRLRWIGLAAVVGAGLVSGWFYFPYGYYWWGYPYPYPYASGYPYGSGYPYPAAPEAGSPNPQQPPPGTAQPPNAPVQRMPLPPAPQ